MSTNNFNVDQAKHSTKESENKYENLCALIAKLQEDLNKANLRERELMSKLKERGQSNLPSNESKATASERSDVEFEVRDEIAGSSNLGSLDSYNKDHGSRDVT